VSTSGEVIDLASENEEKEGDISGITAQDVDNSEETNETESTPTCKSNSQTDSDMEVVEVRSVNSKSKQDTPAATPESQPSKKSVKIEDMFTAAAKTPSSAKRPSVSEAVVTPAKVLKTADMQTPGSARSPSEVTSPAPSGTDPVQVTPTSTREKKATVSFL
jgi:hypothetical protein